MSRYLVIGSGAIGSAVARQLASASHDVTVVTRRGVGVAHPRVHHVAADAANAARLRELARGASAIFNCANPAYHRWTTDWPPIARSLLGAAADSGAVLVTMSNLYGYGRSDGPMSPESPLDADYAKAQVRVAMWRDALAAHEAGRLRATEVRASDFIGPDSQSLASQRIVPRILRGKSCQMLGRLDVEHSWTYTDDVATTLVACAQTPSAWGRAWHVPTNAPRTQRQLVEDLCDAAGVERVRVSVLPPAVLRLAGLVSPLIRELPTTLYQFEAPFVIDDTSTRRALSLAPTPWPEVLAATVNRALDSLNPTGLAPAPMRRGPSRR
jgi:nucleoside-diphosphate-sugar epimerase